MRGGMPGMNDKTWSSGNSYLRLVSSVYQNPKKLMIFCTQSVQELQSVLEAIQTLEAHMSSGKVRLRCLTEIKLQVEDSERSRS